MVNDFEVFEKGIVELPLRYGLILERPILPLALLATDDEHGLAVRQK